MGTPDRAASAPSPGSEALRRLARGEATLEEFLEYHAERAVEHLRATLTPEQLDLVRETVRGQLETDPVLVDLVRRATGSAPARSP